MFRYLIGMYVLVMAACSGSPISPLILGGSDADITDFPFMVSLESNGSLWCGGVIVSATWVLTDSGCPYRTTVIRSDSALLYNGTEHSVVQWVIHPLHRLIRGVNDLTAKYSRGSHEDSSRHSSRSGNTLLGYGKFLSAVQGIEHQRKNVNFEISFDEYDFALVQVDPPFEFGENVAPVILPKQDQDTPDGAEAFILGWGETETALIQVDQLQSAMVATLGEPKCDAYLAPSVSKTSICFKDPKGQVAPCLFDEGGPLVINGTLFGVGPFPARCGNSQDVFVYSRVARIRDWIDEIAFGKSPPPAPSSASRYFANTKVVICFITLGILRFMFVYL